MPTGKIIIIRSGALGDVFVVKDALASIKEAYSWAESILLAPGQRGRLLNRSGFADRVYDWESSVFSWLYSAGAGHPPLRLAEILSGTVAVVAFTGLGGDVRDRFSGLLPDVPVLEAPSRPEAEAVYIGEWLAQKTMDFLQRCGLPASKPIGRFQPRRLVFQHKPFDGLERPYVVFHPGSGSVRKNWPLERYIAVWKAIMADCRTGASGVSPQVVWSLGEADGEIRSRLVRCLPEATIAGNMTLEELAVLLANAALYVGNDTGVSHLAAGVRSARGNHPQVAIIFGPSDDRIWCPPQTRCFCSGDDFSHVSEEEISAWIKESMNYLD